MTAQWADDVHHALHWLLTGEAHGYYARLRLLRRWRTPSSTASSTTGGGRRFRGRTHGRPMTGRPPTRGGFVVSLQTTTRSATALRVSGCARWSTPTGSRSARRCC